MRRASRGCTRRPRGSRPAPSCRWCSWRPSPGLGLSLVVWLLGHGRYDYLVGFALLLGVAQGGGAALLPAVTAQLYGTQGLGRALGRLHTGGGFGCLVGPPVAGAVIDLTDGYAAAIAMSAVVVFGSWGLLRPPGLRRDRSAAGHETSRRLAPGALACVRRFIAALADARALQRAVRELEAMDDHRLHDLGLTRADIEHAVRLGRPSDADIPPTPGGNDRPAAA
jgi:uncharacterized protein YjiS (DUF1127 family)